MLTPLSSSLPLSRPCLGNRSQEHAVCLGQPATQPRDGYQPGPPSPPRLDPFEELENMDRIPGFNWVFGHVAVGVEKCARAWGWLKRKLKGAPKPPAPSAPLPYLLDGHASAQLKRPVLLVPGFNMKPDNFSHLTRKLTENGANGGTTYFVRDGQFYQDFACQVPCLLAPDDKSRVFVASFYSGGDTPDQAAPQLDQNLQAICAATGQPKVDTLGYSMGGLATRVYLDQGGDKVGRFAMLCTPNQGSALAKLSHWLLEIDREGRDVQGLLDWKGLRQVDVPALHWLRPSNGGSPNYHLLDLNSRWPAQRQLVEEALVLGSGSQSKTYTTYVWPVPGDGIVTAGSLNLPGLPRHLFTTRERGSHADMPYKPEVYDALHEFFYWGEHLK